MAVISYINCYLWTSTWMNLSAFVIKCFAAFSLPRCVPSSNSSSHSVLSFVFEFNQSNGKEFIEKFKSSVKVSTRNVRWKTKHNWLERSNATSWARIESIVHERNPENWIVSSYVSDTSGESKLMCVTCDINFNMFEANSQS